MGNKRQERKQAVTTEPCEWCGWDAGRKHAAHIVDEKDGGKTRTPNLISLCPNCHTVFDEKIKPILFRALVYWGVPEGVLPKGWASDNKMSVPADSLIDASSVTVATNPPAEAAAKTQYVVKKER